MNVKIGKYTITSDRYQFIVIESAVSKKTGLDYIKRQTFHPNLSKACEWLLECDLKKSDTVTLGGLKTAINAAINGLKSEIQAMR